MIGLVLLDGIPGGSQSNQQEITSTALWGAGPAIPHIDGSRSQLAAQQEQEG